MTQFSQGALSPWQGASFALPGRWIEALDPAGFRERIEFNENTGFPAQGANELPTNVPDTRELPVAPTTVNVAGTNVAFLPKNTNLHYRNTYYWDKKQMPHPNDANQQRDYANATIRNWLANDNTIVPVLASVKSPLRGRVWFNYPGQVSEHAPGTVAAVAKAVRYTEKADGTLGWIMSRATYNTSTGRPTDFYDELGRRTQLVYAANGIDVTSVRQYSGGTAVTMATLSNYLNHRPRTIVTPGNVTTTLTYNARGQVTQSVTSKGGTNITTTYTFDASGYLTGMAVNGATQATYTHDPAGRVRTTTDATGYTLTYDYDNLDCAATIIVTP